MTRLFMIVILSIVFSCGSLPTQQLRIGMSKDFFYSNVNKGKYKLIGSKKYDNGSVVDVIHWFKVNFNGNNRYVSEEYYLYFYNNSLEQWGRPQDWKREADRIYEVRMR